MLAGRFRYELRWFTAVLEKSNITHQMGIICEKPLHVRLCGHFIAAHIHLHDHICGTADGNPEQPQSSYFLETPIIKPRYRSRNHRGIWTISSYSVDQHWKAPLFDANSRWPKLGLAHSAPLWDFPQLEAIDRNKR
jgi:hypothetical protein